MPILRFLFAFTLLFGASPDASAGWICPKCLVPSGVPEAEVATCQATMRLYHCSDYARDPDLGRYLRSCSREAICTAHQISQQAREFIPGCTGVTSAGVSRMGSNIMACASSADCMSQVPMETLRNLGRMGIGLYEGVKRQLDTVYGLIFDYDNTMGAAKRGTYELHRRLQCLDTIYRDRITCELAGGIFAAATAGGAIAKAVTREAVRTLAVESLSTRASVVAEREAAGQGVRPIAIRRARNSGALAGATSASTNVVSKESAGAPPRAEATREEFVRRLVGRQNTTLEQRQAFAELAAKTTSDGTTVFVDFQNSVLKYLNDRLGNKNVVTAMTNRRLELTFDRLRGLRSRYPTMEEFTYDDFKSGRVAFKFADGKVPAEFLNDVRRIMAESEHAYVDELGKVGIIPDDPALLPPNRWFASGTGRTADQSNAASRYAARTGQTSVDFWDPIVRKNLEGRLAQTDTLRSGLMKSLRNTPLVESLPNGEAIPSTDVFEAYRKSTNASDFAAAIRERTGATVSAQSAQTLRNYLSMLDEWSTGLLVVEKRQSVSFAGSKFNGLTVDVSGMGALNMRELARSLVGERDIGQALVKAREGERSATAIFERNKAAIVSSAKDSLRARGVQVDVRVSGDDIIVLPRNRALTTEDLNTVQDAIAQSASTSNVRISAVAPGVARADEAAVHGENLEKKVRGIALSTIPDQSKYTLMVIRDSGGVSRLRVSARTDGVTPQIDRAFQDAFQRALGH